MKISRYFLLCAALGLTPIALSYGVRPSATLSYLFGIEVEDINSTHIFRAVMGLYLSLVIFWVGGAFQVRLTIPALWSLIVFMFGLAAGRILSLLVDGMPNGVLLLYLGLELGFGFLGLIVLGRTSKALAAT